MADNLNITPEMIDNLVNMFKNSNKTNHNESTQKASSSSPVGEIDFETIMRLKNVMDSINSKNDKDTNLLNSLKPYLRKSRQDKIDQYINILKISQVTKIFRNKNGDT